MVALEPRHHSDVEVNCGDIPEPFNWVCIAAVLIVLIIAVITLIIEVAGSIVDWMEDDDRARDEVNRRTCAEIRELRNSTLARLIQRMLDGATLDDDEDAILRILNCLPCDRVQLIVEEVGRGRLMDDFDGSQWDRLMIRLQECGLAEFGEWDDDATRRFINDVDCSTIAELTLNDIRQLMLNLFSGTTGDDDERAILRMINCMSCSRRSQLVEMRSMSVDDFDDEVDGDS